MLSIFEQAKKNVDTADFHLKEMRLESQSLFQKKDPGWHDLEEAGLGPVLDKNRSKEESTGDSDELAILVRDEDTGRPYWLNSHTMKRWPIRDLEAGAMRRLKDIMARYPDLAYYVQGDPRGCALYILRPGDVPEGGDPSCYYSRGIAVCK